MVVGLGTEREHHGCIDEPNREHRPVGVVEAQQERQRLALELTRAGHAERQLAGREAAASRALPAQVGAHATDHPVGNSGRRGHGHGADRKGGEQAVRASEGSRRRRPLGFMDVTSVCAAFGLSAAAGLNAWLPLFAGALLNRLDVVELAQPFDDLTGTGTIVVLGVLTAADFVGDKAPAVDHVLHAVGTVVAPVSGAVLFTGQTGVDTDLPTLAAVVLGAGTAETVRRPRRRPATLHRGHGGGVGNPILSLLEDIGSALLVVMAFVVPVLALLLVVALLVALFAGWRRLRRRPAAA